MCVLLIRGWGSGLSPTSCSHLSAALLHAAGGQAGHSRTLYSHPPTLPDTHLPLCSPQVAAKLGTKPNFLGTLRVAPLFEMLEDL